MIIVSQDKKSIVNFEQMARLYVDTWSNEEFATEPNCFCIKAEKASDNIYMFLGEYTTEERAKEILREITQSYINEMSYKYNQCMLIGEVEEVQEKLVYEIPED